LNTFELLVNWTVNHATYHWNRSLSYMRENTSRLGYPNMSAWLIALGHDTKAPVHSRYHRIHWIFNVHDAPCSCIKYINVQMYELPQRYCTFKITINTSYIANRRGDINSIWNSVNRSHHFIYEYLSIFSRSSYIAYLFCRKDTMQRLINYDEDFVCWIIFGSETSDASAMWTAKSRLAR